MTPKELGQAMGGEEFDSHEWVTVKQAAAEAELTYVGLLRYVQDGRLKSIQPGRDYLIARCWLEEFLANPKRYGGLVDDQGTLRDDRRGSLSPKVRFRVLVRDRFACRYCGRKAPDVELAVDHVKPVARGGADDPSNLVTSCRDCNAGKGDTVIWPEEEAS